MNRVRGVVCAVTALWMTASTASAADNVFVAPPVMAGEAPEHVAAAMQAAASEGLGDVGVAEAAAPEGCASADCMFGEGGKGLVVVPSVAITGSDYALSVEIRDEAGQVQGQAEATCEICTYEEASAALRELVAKTAGSLAPAEPAVTTGTLRIDSSPSGATVSIDGVAVGTTPYEGQAEAGSHTVEVAANGRTTQQRDVDLVADTVATESFDLPRKALMSPKLSNIVGWSAVGVGAASVITGIALIVLDKNDVKRNCSGASVDIDGDCEFRYDTLAGGIVFTAAGVIVAGGGAALLIQSRRANGRQPRAEARLTPGGVRVRF